MKKKYSSFAVIAWIIALVLVPIALWAQSNQVTITMPDGKTITVDVPQTFAMLWAKWGGILFTFVATARVVLKFLPASDEGSTSPLAKIVHALKHISLAIPDKHTDVTALPPVTNISSQATVGIANTKIASLFFAIALALPMLGCTTLKSLTPAQYAKIGCGAAPLVIGGGMIAVNDLVLTNPVQKAAVNADIYTWSANLHSLLTGNQLVTPAALATALNAKTPEVKAIGDLLAATLGPSLAALNSQGTNGIAATVQIIDCIAVQAEAAAIR